MKWWPYYNGHYLLNKGTDLKKLFNDYDTDQVMDMIDSLLVSDSVYDEEHQGQVLKKRASLNKDYGRIGNAIDNEGAEVNSGTRGTQYLESAHDEVIPGLDPRIPMMGG